MISYLSRRFAHAPFHSILDANKDKYFRRTELAKLQMPPVLHSDALKDALFLDPTSPMGSSTLKTGWWPEHKV